MNVTNCRGCGRLFNVISNPRLCPQCVSKLEDTFQKVKAYLEENPNSTVDDVSKANDVPVKQIKQWIREERLTFAEGSVGGIGCESCGALIRTGRFCDSCKFKISNNLASALDKPKMNVPKKQEHEKDRMRFLQNQL